MQVSRTTRRHNPLTGDWVLVSRGRTNRPWSGQTERADDTFEVGTYASDCHLCPGNARATGHRNPGYRGVFVFDNDFPAIAKPDDNADDQPLPQSDGGLFVSQQETGVCRVICFSHDHSLTLAQMSSGDIVPVVQCYRDQTDDLLSGNGIEHVQIFENRGAVMGCSNPHPHAQVWAQSHTPTLPAREVRAQQGHYRSHGNTLLLDYASEELKRRERVVCANDHFVVVVPYWAAWPFETLVIPTRPAGLLTDLSDDQVVAFASILRRITVRYDNLFRTSFPYSAGIHQRPSTMESPEAFHLHMHFFPPLLRSATVKKFMVGYEMLAEAQRDLSPEDAAAILREQSETHFFEAEAPVAGSVAS